MTFTVTDFSIENSAKATYSEKFQQLDIPINAGIRYKNFRIGGGPIFHFIQEVNSDIRSLSDLSIKHKNITAGFQGSVGYDWSVFHFDLRYQTDFNSVSDHIYFNNTRVNHKATPSSIQLGIAVALEKK